MSQGGNSGGAGCGAFCCLIILVIIYFIYCSGSPSDYQINLIETTCKTETWNDGNVTFSSNNTFTIQVNSVEHNSIEYKDVQILELVVKEKNVYCFSSEKEIIINCNYSSGKEKICDVIYIIILILIILEALGFILMLLFLGLCATATVTTTFYIKKNGYQSIFSQ